MNLLKTIVITTAINVPLAAYVSTLIPKSVETQGSVPIALTAKANDPVIAKQIDTVQQNDDVVTLKTDVVNLKLELAALREEMHSMTKVKVDTAILGRDADKSVPRSDEEIRAEEEKHFAVQGEALESGFRQQTIAPKWSAEAMALVRAGLAKDKISGDAIVSLECRTHSCRLELANNGKNQTPDFVEFPQHIAGELSNVMVSQTESSDSSTVFYLSKEEFVLPD
jgi:hypothetical protein